MVHLNNEQDEPLLRDNPDRFTMFPIKCVLAVDVSLIFGPTDVASRFLQVPGHLGDVQEGRG